MDNWINATNNDMKIVFMLVLKWRKKSTNLAYEGFVFFDGGKCGKYVHMEGNRFSVAILFDVCILQSKWNYHDNTMSKKQFNVSFWSSWWIIKFDKKLHKN